MRINLLLFMVGSMVFSAAAFAQGGAKGSASGSTTPAADPSMGPERSSDIGKFSNMDNLMKQGRPGDYLGGKVTVQGGALPWEPISVTVACNGKTRYNTNTDAKGNFLIASTNPVPGSPTAKAEVKPTLPADLAGCAVQAFLPGFDSSSVTITNSNLQDNPNVGTITLKREEGSEGAALSSTSASASKDATKAFEKARAEWIDKKSDRAQHDLEKAVQVYPQFAEAWYQLGKIQETSNAQEAMNSFSKALAADPKFILPYDHLAALAAHAGKWQELVDYTNHELALNPRGTPEVWYYNALGNLKLNKPDVAEVSAEKALAMDPIHTEPNTEQLMAVILVGKRDYVGALQHLRNCATYLPAGPNLDLVKQQIAQLEKAVRAAQ